MEEFNEKTKHYYRYMDIDYVDGSGADLFKYDMTMQRPLLGLNCVW